jgi:hypothetical protein
MQITDEQLATWTKPAFGNEKERANNTEQLIRSAIQDHPLLGQLPTRVFAKGSYKNNTNVRRSSDIDVAVEYQELITLEFAGGATFSHTGLVPYHGAFRDSGGLYGFKNAVGEALRQAFGFASVDASGNRVFRVTESTKSLAADVVPCTTYRLYWPGGQPRQGIELILDRSDGKRHINFPDQHYYNGVQKNLRTSKRFKHTVRILKNIESRLSEAGTLPPLPSYFIECLAYNVFDQVYTDSQTWREIVEKVSAVIWGYCQQPEPTTESNRWREVNNHKWLFHDQQRWTRGDAGQFASMAYAMVTR